MLKEMTDEMRVPATHLIKVKFHGPTNSRGARVGMTSLRFNDRVIVDYDYNVPSISGCAGTAVNWLTAHNFTVLFIAESTECYFLGVKEFDSLHSHKK